MTIKNLLLALIAAAGFALVAVPAYASHTWANLHWARTTSSFTLALGDNLTSNWDAYLQTTSADWSASSVLDTKIVPGGTNNKSGTKTPRRCAPTSGRGEICNYKYGYTGWLGIASIWVSGGHITQGTVKLNDTYFNTSTYNKPEWRNLVMCQEVGHIFGLDHQDENMSNANLDTCMDYTNSPASNQHPNAHDYEMLEQIYAHLDSTTTVKPVTTTSSFAAEDSNDPRDFGRELRRSRDGRASLFVQELSDGSLLYRHIFWAEEAPRNTERSR